MNLLKRFFTGCLSALVVQICFCSLPSDIEPVNWKMHLELPVTEKRYNIRELLDKGDISGDLEINKGVTDTIGDTIYIFKTDSMDYTIEKDLIVTDTSVTQEKIGERTLQNTPQVDILFQFPSVDGFPEGVPISGAVPFVKSHDENLNGIQSVTIDESSPGLEVYVKNTSQGGNIENLTVSLLDAGSLIGSYHAEALGAGAQIVAPFEIQGKTIRSPITVAIDAIIAEGSALRANEGLNVSFNLDNIRASEAVVVDSLITYSDTFSGTMSLADSIRLDLIDVDQALIRCEINNPCAFRIGLTGIIENTWASDFARDNNINTLEKLGAITDSSAFAGRVIQDTVFMMPGIYRYSKDLRLNNLRLFPSWDGDSGKSVLNFRYIVHSLPDGRWVTFKKEDEISFKLVPVQFPFVQISGRFTQPLEERFSSEENIGFGWSSSIIDSLKRSFRFQSAKISLSIVPDLPAGSFLDSMKLHLALEEKNKGSDPVVLDKVFEGIYPGLQHSASLELASLLNTWPDTIAFNTRVALPAGCRLELHNRKDRFGNYSKSFTIGIKVNWDIRIQLHWGVLDTIRMELDKSSFSLDVKEDIDWVRKIRHPRVKIKVDALNNTNLQFTLHALGASDENMQTLMTTPDSLIYSYSPDIDGPQGDTGPVFRLFGPRGLNLPPRQTRDSMAVDLDQRGIDALLSDGDCHIRWFLIIPGANPDALTDHDYFDIKATAVIEGVGNSDSLLYWGDSK